MSKENVVRFYEYLDRMPAVKAKALALQTIHEEQEELFKAFIALAEEEGFPFEIDEFIEVLYSRARYTDSGR